MKTGELARMAGVPIDTVRYYERQGVLPEPSRTAAGYRQYGLDALVASCPGHGALEHCPILDALADERHD